VIAVLAGPAFHDGKRIGVGGAVRLGVAVRSSPRAAHPARTVLRVDADMIGLRVKD
jgi:hypothetical protein